MFFDQASPPPRGAANHTWRATLAGDGLNKFLRPWSALMVVSITIQEPPLNYAETPVTWKTPARPRRTFNNDQHGRPGNRDKSSTQPQGSYGDISIYVFSKLTISLKKGMGFMTCMLFIRNPASYGFAKELHEKRLNIFSDNDMQKIGLY